MKKKKEGIVEENSGFEIIFIFCIFFINKIENEEGRGIDKFLSKRVLR